MPRRVQGANLRTGAPSAKRAQQEDRQRPCAVHRPRSKSKRISMSKLSRRSVLRGSAGLAAAGTLGRPFIANAAGKTATVYWLQGFVPEEDASFRTMVAEYEKTSGNTIDYSIVPFGPMVQKIVAAITSGDVPDLIQG